jgi:hypothetical protein
VLTQQLVNLGSEQEERRDDHDGDTGNNLGQGKMSAIRQGAAKTYSSALPAELSLKVAFQ